MKKSLWQTGTVLGSLLILSMASAQQSVLRVSCEFGGSPFNQGSIQIDGKDAANCPKADVTVAAGEHLVKVTISSPDGGLYSGQEKVTVSKNDVARVTVRLNLSYLPDALFWKSSAPFLVPKVKLPEVSFLAAGSTVFGATEGEVVHLYSAANGIPIGQITADDAIAWLSFTPKDQQVVLITNQGLEVRSLDGRLLYKIPVEQATFTGVSSDGTQVFVATDTALLIFDLKARKEVTRIKLEEPILQAMAGTNSNLIWVLTNTKLRGFDWRGQEKTRLSNSADLNELTASAAAGVVAATSNSGEIRVWDISKPQSPSVLRVDDLGHFALSTDGRWLYVSRNDELNIYEIPRLKLVRTVLTKETRLLTNPATEGLISVNAGTVKLWNGLQAVIPARTESEFATAVTRLPYSNLITAYARIFPDSAALANLRKTPLRNEPTPQESQVLLMNKLEFLDIMDEASACLRQENFGCTFDKLSQAKELTSAKEEAEWQALESQANQAQSAYYRRQNEKTAAEIRQACERQYPGKVGEFQHSYTFLFFPTTDYYTYMVTGVNASTNEVSVKYTKKYTSEAGKVDTWSCTDSRLR